MTDKEGNSNLISQLITLSEIDSKLARIRSDRKKAQATLEGKKSEHSAADKKLQTGSNILTEKRSMYEREEKRLEHERQKLIERRKALATLNNYKLQQAAEREIEHASRGLGSQEEILVKALDEISGIDGQVKELEELFKTLSEQLETTQKETEEYVTELDSEEEEHSRTRENIVKSIPEEALSAYDMVAGRNPSDAVVPLNGDSCSGCFMHLGPQFAVRIARGEEIVRCRGCGRILFLEENKEEQGK